ncbi:sugar-binding domain-containing protein, partial [Robinsoniella sp. RHS]
MRIEKKRTIFTRCLGGGLAVALTFGQLAVPADAAQMNEKSKTETVISNAESRGVAEETVIGSESWETPLIPDAAAEIPGVSEHKISLNETTGDGTWKFLFNIPDYTEPNGVPAPTEKKQEFNFDAWSGKNWENIKVPGEALMQGFDILTNNEYYYQREITIPEDFAENRIMVRFDGVYSNARVWIDGEYIRTHTGGFTTWDCDITEYAAPGQTVTMTVGVADLYSDT